MSTQVYDAIVVGAGSVGLPAAFFMAQLGLKPLVIDQFPSPGQGCNKAAIGGVRATHSTPAKIRLCLDSIRVFSAWREGHGDEIEWQANGYAFVAYGPNEERVLKDLLQVQQRYGLNIHWHEGGALREIIPALSPEGLLGGTFSPEDGSASPLLSSQAFYRAARRLGVEFRFGERVTGVIRRRGRVAGVRTESGGYATGVVVNAAGPWARTVALMTGLDIPVVPDSHEAGITEPVAPFIQPMIVDIRPVQGSKNYYFYQHKPGQVVFCITPEPPIVGTDRRETSSFLPMIAGRMVELIPRLASIKVRRTWRGLYPMTPDGSPLVGWSRELEGCLHAVGMCGQGYMLGPGVGRLVARMVAHALAPEDAPVLEELNPYRAFGGDEALK